MKSKSITRYLLLNASIWAIVVAFASGIVLSQFFRTSAERAFDEQLDIALKILVGDLASQIEGGLTSSPSVNLGDPRYKLPLSGWYWTVHAAGTSEILVSSESLVGGNLQFDKSRGSRNVASSVSLFHGTGPDGLRLRILEREIAFTQFRTLVVRVTGNAEDLERQVADFQRKAWLIMTLFGVVLLGVTFFLVRSALRPLNALQTQVRKVSEGQAERIEGSYPSEVSGLVGEANLLIASNRHTLERARTQVGNLAHALKTPLSVIMNEAQTVDPDKGDLFSQQAEVMRDQIQLYLERARMAAGRSVIGTVTHVYPVLEKLVTVMQKIHPAQTIHLSSDGARTVSFRGERHDLEEMVGNLVDNACKWAKTTIQIHLSFVEPDHEGAMDEGEVIWLSISIEDDGPGMSQADMERATKRGLRLDESKPGTGLGLAIVEEMTALYNGRFTLDGSALGGVRATVILPAIETSDR